MYVYPAPPCFSIPYSFISDGTTAIFLVFLLFIIPSLPCIPFVPTRRRPPDSKGGGGGGGGMQQVVVMGLYSAATIGMSDDKRVVCLHGDE